MTCWIRSEVFDHAILHSSVKWYPATVSSFLEELKLVCPNRTLTQSKWIESVSTKMAVCEAQCYWSMFMSCRQSVLGHVGEWMELGTLGIFLFSQAYAQARARADSNHHNEALFHSLATTMAVPSISVGQRSMSHKSQLLSSSAKLVRDNSGILQFVVDNLLLLIKAVTVRRIYICLFSIHISLTWTQISILMCRGMPWISWIYFSGLRIINLYLRRS